MSKTGNVFAYTDPRPAKPGFMVPYLSLNRGVDMHLTLTARDRTGRHVEVEIPQQEWVRLLREAVQEL